MKENTRSLDEAMDLLLRMFDKSFDWEAWWDRDEPGDGPRDVFAEIAKWHDYREGNRPVGTHECGGHRFADTPKALYRAMYLLRPTHMDAGDMYKTDSMIEICSPDYQFVASFVLWKYEASLYFSCPSEMLERIRKRGGITITCGIPGSDNGIRCKDKQALKWFDVIKRSLEWTWPVYGGNDFEV